MSETATSSAIPERLFRYANSAEQIDYGLVAESASLSGRLQQFEGQCSEPQFSIRASHLGSNLHRYGEQCKPVDQWVREIGYKFRNADLLVGWSVSTSTQNRKSALPTSRIAWSISFAIASLIPGVPVWLLSLARGVSWINRGQRSESTHNIYPESTPVPVYKQGGFNTILETISTSPTEQTGGLSASGASATQSSAARTHLQQKNPVGRDERDEQLLKAQVKYRETNTTTRLQFHHF